MNIGYTLATLNASLNALAALLLLLGWRAIREKKITLHRKYMGSAFAVSCIFLISYLTRVFLTGTTRYPREGWDRYLYLSILTSHTLLAAIVPVLSVRTLYLALKNRIDAHRRLARWTLPIWSYVSVTGVVVYLMLYQWAGVR